MSTVRAVIFDLGHTLWDYAPTKHSRRLAAVRLHQCLVDELGDETPHPAELERALLGQLEQIIGAWYLDGSRLEQPTSDVFVRQALAGLETELSERLVEEVTQLCFGTELDIPVVLPDTLVALADLQNTGVVMGCVTNTVSLPECMVDLLQRLGLVRYLGAIVVSSGAGYRKPHASLFQQALDDLGVEADTALFVGDRLLDDISGAKALGMRAVLTHQFRQEPLANAIVPPDAVIRSIEELPRVVHGLAQMP